MQYTDVFHHIPKAAGTTLSLIAQRQYPLKHTFRILGAKKATIRNFRKLPPSTRARFRLIYGHQAFQLLNHTHSPRLVTMLRDPVRRVVSLYYYVKYTNHKHVLTPLTQRYSLTEFFKNHIDADWPEFRNGQVASIRGILSSRLCRKLPHSTEFSAIKYALRKYILFGLTEQFDESILLFRLRLGWEKPVYYQKKNVTSYDRELPAWLIEYIRQNNEDDVDLYAFAKQEFRSALEQHTQIQEQLKRFRYWNSFLGPYYSQIDHLKSLCFRLRHYQS